MVTLTIQGEKLITVRSDQGCDTYRLVSLEKRYIAGEMLVIVKAEDRIGDFKYEMHFPAHSTIIIYKNVTQYKSENHV